MKKKKVKLWLRLEPTKVLSSLGCIEFAPIFWIFKLMRLNLASDVRISQLYTIYYIIGRQRAPANWDLAPSVKNSLTYSSEIYLVEHKTHHWRVEMCLICLGKSRSERVLLNINCTAQKQQKPTLRISFAWMSRSKLQFKVH